MITESNVLSSTPNKENKTLCSNISYEKSKSLYRTKVIIEEKETGKRFEGLVVDHCFDDDFGFICRISKKSAKGIIKKYKMGQAEDGFESVKVFPDYVEVDLRKTQQGAHFYLIEIQVQKPIFFKKTTFEQLKVGQTVLVLSLNMHNVMSSKGIDEVIGVSSESYEYIPCYDRTKKFSCVKKAVENAEFFVIENIDNKRAYMLQNDFKNNLGILPQYTEVWAEMYKLSHDEVYEIVKTQLQGGSSFISFMCLFNQYSKVVNDIYYSQHKVKDYILIKNSFRHIFNPLG